MRVSKVRVGRHRALVNWFALILLLFTFLLPLPCNAQVSNVDWDIQEIYEHYTGVSLAEAVQKLRAVPKQSPNSLNNVYVQLNGGGIDNRLYAGQNNTLQVYISNQDSLEGFTLALEFSCEADSFAWVPNYGTSGSQYEVYIHDDAFVPDHPWYYYGGIYVTDSLPPDSILVGGAVFSVNHHMPPHQDLTLLWSMQIWIPPDTPPESDGFSVDNIFYPPAGSWVFADITHTSVVPDFQGNSNLGANDPTAPPVHFDIADGFCYDQQAKSESPTIKIPPKDWPRVVKDYEHYPALQRMADGDLWIDVTMTFTGNDAELKNLGVKLGTFRFSENMIGARFPLRLLPRVSLVRGVQRIATPETFEYKLNYSTEVVHGNYVAIQHDHGLTGEGVVVGIIDSGVDWLHDDFIDSSGNTRIKFFWDQTALSGSPPSDLGFGYGAEWDSSDIQGFIASSYSGIDHSGHGTHVAGVAVGDGSSSDSGYVGLAPKAALAVVKLDRTDVAQIERAIEYVARRAYDLDLPWAINLSEALPYTQPSARDGSQRTEQFIDSVVNSADASLGSGRVIVCAVGNDADSNLHALGKGDDVVELSIGVDSSPGQAVDHIKICVLYHDYEDPEISVISPDGDTVGPVGYGCVSNLAMYSGYVVDTNAQTTDGAVRIFHGHFDESTYGPGSGDPIYNHPIDKVAVVELRDEYYTPTGLLYQLRPGTWKIKMDGMSASEPWDAYIYDRDSTNKSFEPDDSNAIHTISSPATAAKCIAVGSTNSTRHYWTDALNHVNSVPFSAYPPGEITAYSNLGPTRSGGFKPELYAPGAMIMSSRSSDVTENNWANDTSLFYHDKDDVHNIWEGTSIAAPHVTGAAALALELNPDLPADSVKLALTGGADPRSVYLRILNVDSTLNILHPHGLPGQRNPESSGEPSLPTAFTLYQNYPNPFNPSTRIEFEVPNQRGELTSKVRVDVYNILGQRIATLVDGVLRLGHYSLLWDGTTIGGKRAASGVYLYRCVCDGSADTKKMVLLK